MLVSDEELASDGANWRRRRVSDSGEPDSVAGTASARMSGNCRPVRSSNRRQISETAQDPVCLGTVINEPRRGVTDMPLDPQAALAIKLAGDLPANLTHAELRRAYSEQRIKMLPPAPPIAIARDVSIPSPEGDRGTIYRPHDDGIACPCWYSFMAEAGCWGA